MGRLPCMIKSRDAGGDLAQRRQGAKESRSRACRRWPEMKDKDNHKMGRFSVDIEIANNEDLIQAQHGHLDPTKVRRVTIRGVVDSGATRLGLPQTVGQERGLAVQK